MKYFIFLIAFSFASCSSADQSNEPSKHYLLVTLTEGVNGGHLRKNYKSSGIKSIRSNNRSKNIYACQFEKTQDELAQLVRRMNQDRMIVLVEVAEIATE